ncbi:hypothetical protein [Synechococcus sp. PCC 7336]|nr:hypothetical protein [Synechococcus sp. PCC 7336]
MPFPRKLLFGEGSRQPRSPIVAIPRNPQYNRLQARDRWQITEVFPR